MQPYKHELSMYNGKECKGAYTIDKPRMKVKGSSIILGAQIGCSKYIAVPVWQPFLNELNQAEASPLKDNKMEWEGAWLGLVMTAVERLLNHRGTFSCYSYKIHGPVTYCWMIPLVVYKKHLLQSCYTASYCILEASVTFIVCLYLAQKWSLL